MIKVPEYAREVLAPFDLENGMWHTAKLKGLMYDGFGISLAITGLKALISTADFDIDGDGPGGSKTLDSSYLPETSLRTDAGKSLDSREFPGLVLAPKFKDYGAKIGDFGMLIWHHSVMIGFQLYDVGPSDKAGEGSIHLARKAGIIPPSVSDRDALNKGNNVKDVVSVVFCGTAPGIGTSPPNHAIAASLVDQCAFSFWPTLAQVNAPA